MDHTRVLRALTSAEVGRHHVPVTDNNDILRTLAADLEIRNALALLAELTDQGDLAVYRELLADDVHYDMFGNMTDGADTVLAGMGSRRASGNTGPGSNTRHVLTTVRVEVQSATDASSHALWQFYTDTSGAKTLSVLGTYDDRWVNRGTGWKLASRAVAAA